MTINERLKALGGEFTMMDEANTQRQAVLVEKARMGDPQAGESLLQLHRERLRRMIDSRLDPAISRREDASDIVQNVIFEAHKRLAQYLANPSMPFQLWLRHIAQDHIIDAHRRHRQAQRRSLDREQYLSSGPMSDQSSMDLAAQLFDRQPTPASEAMRHELRNNLISAINSLNSDDREVILMRHVEQMSNQEVASTQGVTEAAASMRYLRAIRRLKETLAAGNSGSQSDDFTG